MGDVAFGTAIGIWVGLAGWVLVERLLEVWKRSQDRAVRRQRRA